MKHRVGPPPSVVQRQDDFPVAMANDLEYGRESFQRGAWSDAYEALGRADRAEPLDRADLHRIGVSACLIGRDLEYEAYFARLFHLHVEHGELPQAARCAFWVGFNHFLRGEQAQANAWFARGQQLIDGIDCVESAYLGSAAIEAQLRHGEADAALAAAKAASGIAARFGDADLLAITRHLQGRALLQLDRVGAGLDVLDQTMLPVVGGELSPIVTGLMYCSVIEACRRNYEMRRAREWTLAFMRWCERQTESFTFRGTCLVDRAEILRFYGEWPGSLADAFHACECAARDNRKPPAAAVYHQGEIYRLRGEHREAEEAYRAASQLGFDPQPGLALLRLAQGNFEAACAAMRRAMGTTTNRFQRARLLPAGVEVLLAMGLVQEARSTCRELQDLADALAADVLRAASEQASGAVALGGNEAGAAMAPLRHAFELWTQLGAPYDAARTRVLIALACRTLGDEDTARLEFAAARATFQELRARTDVDRVNRLQAHRAPREGRLSPREMEVLRLIAAGDTNRSIASRLGVSERTVDRHVSNILTKLDVPSRAAATAFAYEHQLL